MCKEVGGNVNTGCGIWSTPLAPREVPVHNCKERGGSVNTGCGTWSIPPALR